MRYCMVTSKQIFLCIVYVTFQHKSSTSGKLAWNLYYKDRIVNLLPNDKTLDMSKFKTFADNNSDMAYMPNFSWMG